MSLTHEQKTTVANETPTRSWWRFLRFPLIVLVLFGSIFAIPWVCVALDFYPEWAPMPFAATQFLAPLAAVLLLVLWWIFFSGTRWMVRLCGVLLVAVLIGGFFYSLRDFQLTMGRVSLVPRIDFTWDPSAEDKLAQESKREGSIADTLPIIDATVGPEDFPAYRGPKTDGVIAHAKVEWKTPLEVLWRKPCPGGYSGVAVAGNIAVTLQQRVKEKKEVVVCYDRATGAHRWFYAYDAYHKDVMGDGPRSTPTIHDNHVYSIGATG